MGYLEGKRILFIGIGFYDYEEDIMRCLEKLGATVEYLNTCPNDFLNRFFLRVNMFNWSVSRLQRLRTKKLRSLSVNNDIVFAIKGENLTRKDIIYLRSHNPQARFILYLWDSLIRHTNLDILLSNFDNILSFDRIDCLSNTKFKFRPLFYRTLPVARPKEYYLSFVGWMHSDRLAIVRSIRNQLDAQGKSYCIKLYMGRLSYFFARYVTRILNSDDRGLITLEPIPYREYQQITAASQVVLDIAHPQQSGLTIRTIETLAAGCHLMTTNADIMNYPRISADSYTVFERNNPSLPTQIISVEPISIYFSIETFVKNIFDEK